MFNSYYILYKKIIVNLLLEIFIKLAIIIVVYGDTHNTNGGVYV